MAERASILVVDDDADTLHVWSVSLRAAGYEVSTAADGVTAYETATAKKPDLVVLDLDLPGRSGYDVATMLRRQPSTRRIPLVAATGFSHEAQLERARRAGFDVIVVKPCDPGELIGHIARLIAASASGQGATEGR